MKKSSLKMDPAAAAEKEKEKKKTRSKCSYHIGGISVEFPYQAYGSQLAFMGRVISTLDRAHRDGHCHALLESPTGTGKSLSLLCSALAWQHHHSSLFRLNHHHHINININPLSNSKPAPEAYVDPLAHGGGFVSESPSATQPATSTAKDKASKKKIVPTIFYASRTHSQITQVVREYKKTTYRVPMVVLASKKHYCTNSNVRDNGNVDEDCKLLLKDKRNGCPQFKNVNKVKSHHSLQKGGLYEVHDIEDLLKVGHQMKGCSYFAARSMAEDAQLVFCPYSYIINPIIRKAMEVDIEKAIIILDEAHNIEDMARDAGSVDAEEGVLHKLQVELGQLACGNPTLYQPLHEMMMDLIEWMERRKDTLEKREFQHYFSCWTGDKALRELQEANISQQCFPILQDCATKAFKATLDAESEEAHLSPMSATTLEGLFSSLSYFFSGNGAHVNDYQLALQRYIKKDAQVNDNQLALQPYNKRNAGNTASDWTYTFSLWSLNPAIVFKNIADLSLSVILTSGTLSPMNSFSSELGVQFGTSLEAPHIIDVESQLWAAVISTGPGNYPLNASYKTADGYAFQDSLGQSLEEICKIVPGGSLIFFPSYKLMDKLCSRWRQTGQWSRLSAQKPLYVEPRGNQDEFEAALTGYYDAISGKTKPAAGRKRKGKKLGVKSCDSSSFVDNHENGAAFLAVCRGKISEGIDFSDEKARVVIIVGIPFPNINDIQVAQKKKYNDTFKSSRNLLTGNEWYCHQAFRALNQAAGRCIRHRCDYGAVIFLDERFCQERNNMYISKWLRKSMKHYNSFDQSLEELKSFFSEVKERLSKEAPNIAPSYGDNLEKSSAIEQNEGIPRKKSPQVNKSHKLPQKLDSDCTMESSPICVETYDARFTQSKYESKFNNPGKYIDLECSSQQDLRNSPASSRKIYYDDPDLTVVQETPDINVSHNPAYKDETSSSTITQCHTEFGGQFPSHTTSLPNTNLGPSKCTHSMTTPEKFGSVGTNCSLAESTVNLSVNSHTQKRRKSIGSTFANLIKVENFDSPGPSNPTNIGYTSSSMPSHGVQKFKFSNGFNSPSEKMSLDHVTNERLQICCSLCKKPLGLPENHFFVSCSIDSSSKVYLTTLLKGRCEASSKSTPKMPVLICDISSVDHQLYNSRTREGNPGQGIWSKEDGCVFNSVLCPFCMEPDNCLGVQIMATDAANLQLLDKVMFYRDRLETMDLEASKEKEPIEKGSSPPVHVPEKRTYASPISIEDFAYVSKQQKSDGWRTTRSKMQLPKRGLLHTG